MSTKAEYLQKYITGEKKGKKLRKKSKLALVQPRIHIIDDDATTVTNSKDGVLESEEEVGEEAPQVAEIIDESSERLKMQSGKWKTLDNTTERDHWKQLGSYSDLSPSRNELSPKCAGSEYSDAPNRDLTGVAAYPAKNKSALQNRLDSDSDLSPPRHPLLDKDHNARTRHGRKSDDDLSPARSKHNLAKKSSMKNENHQPKMLDSDSDLSPPRHHLDRDADLKSHCRSKRASDSDLSSLCSYSKHIRSPKRASAKDDRQQKRLDTDSDLSPPRHELSKDDNSKNHNKHKRDPSSDLSPLRSNSPKRSLSKGIPQKKHEYSDSDISPPTHKLHVDKIVTNKREHSHEASTDSDSSSPHANSKHSTSGKKRKKSRHKLIKSEKQPKVQKGASDKKETTGLKQETKDKQNEVSTNKLSPSNKIAKNEEDFGTSFGDGNETWVPDLFKPFARYRDDPELDEYLKKQERSGDTMLEYIRSKKKKEPSEETTALPVYKGPPPPPNRFNIMPGYRWDGVDRSNGFEKKYFELQAKKKSQAELAYKWSVENM